MEPGLKKILELIKSSPSDQRLVDRYLVLVADIPDAQRAEALLQVAKVLLVKFPIKAIDIAWMVFKKGQSEQDSLAVIASALETLGRSGKAAAIRADASRLTMHLKDSPENRQARSNIERLIGIEASQPVLQFSEELRTKTNNSLAGLSNNLESKSLSHEAPQVLDDQINKPSVQGAEKLNRQHPAPETTSLIPLIKISEPNISAGIPEAIPRKEASSHSKSISQRLMDDRTSVAKNPERTESSYDHEFPDANDLVACQGYISEKMSSGRWDELMLFFTSVLREGVSPQILELFDANSLHKIDIKFAEIWIDMLVASRQERRATRFILKVMAEQPLMAWAKMAHPKMSLICERLGLEPFNWRELDGVQAFMSLVASSRPKANIYIVFPTIAS